MTVVQGTVPFPPQADPKPLIAGAASLQRAVTALIASQAQVTATSSLSKSNWQGAAASATIKQLEGRIEHTAEIIVAVEAAAPVLTTLAAAVTASEAAYSAAAAAEQAARAGLPWTAAALAAAIAEEGVALAMLEAAGAAAAAELAVIAAALEALDFGGMADLASIGGQMVSYGLTSSGALPAGGTVAKAIAPTLTGAVTGGVAGAVAGAAGSVLSGLVAPKSASAGTGTLSGAAVPTGAGAVASTVERSLQDLLPGGLANDPATAAETLVGEVPGVGGQPVPLSALAPAPTTPAAPAEPAVPAATIGGAVGDGFMVSGAVSAGANDVCAATVGVGAGVGAQVSGSLGTLPEPGLSVAANGTAGGLDLDGSISASGAEATVAVPAPLPGLGGAAGVASQARESALPVGISHGVTGSVGDAGASLRSSPWTVNVGEAAGIQLKDTVQFPCPPAVRSAIDAVEGW